MRYRHPTDPVPPFSLVRAAAALLVFAAAAALSRLW